jgi:hypothetical protein
VAAAAEAGAAALFGAGAISVALFAIGLNFLTSHQSSLFGELLVQRLAKVDASLELLDSRLEQLVEGQHETNRLLAGGLRPPKPPS